jgi:hypothetical protein
MLLTPDTAETPSVTKGGDGAATGAEWAASGAVEQQRVEQLVLPQSLKNQSSLVRTSRSNSQLRYCEVGNHHNALENKR